MSPQWHVEDPGHSAKSAGQVTPKHTPLDPSKSEWADYAAVQAECGNLSGNELIRKPSENTRSQSSQLAEPLWTVSGQKSGISVRELISNKKIKKTHAGSELSNILPKSSHARKKPPQPPPKYLIEWPVLPTQCPEKPDCTYRR